MDYFMEMDNKFGDMQMDTDMLGEIDTDMLDTDSLDTDKGVGIWAPLKQFFNFDTDVEERKEEEPQEEEPQEEEPKEEEPKEEEPAVLEQKDAAEEDEDCFKKAMQEKVHTASADRQPVSSSRIFSCPFACADDDDDEEKKLPPNTGVGEVVCSWTRCTSSRTTFASRSCGGARR
jgi:FtsZ-interacting cell division protein YlmF